jgi:hypothetical protein
LLAAVVAAAFIGNMYYHLLRYDNLLIGAGFLEAIYALRSRFFYCALLALGLYISMARQQKKHGLLVPTDRFARIRRIFGVWTFFGMIAIWNVKGETPYFTRVDFFMNLFSLS